MAKRQGVSNEQVKDEKTRGKQGGKQWANKGQIRGKLGEDKEVQRSK